MIAARLLDVLLVLVMLVYLGEGIRNGFVRSISAILGVVAGGTAAFFLIPLISVVLPDPFWRTVLVVAASTVLLVGGHAAGAAIGRAIRGRKRELHPLDRLFGGVANLVVSALVISLIAGGVGALGIATLTRAAANSYVLDALARITPDPVEGALAQLRGAVVSQGLPTIPGRQEVGPSPTAPTDTDPLVRAQASVVRITGTAYACSQTQSGSGFVVAPDRVLTNAHVVAGVPQPLVEVLNGARRTAIVASVVSFDPERDLAVLAVPGLPVPPLTMGDALATGADAVVDGYPFGGPFESHPARVLGTSRSSVADIYDRARTVREIYSLAADVEPGNSGGPLLDPDGRIAGIVFAKSADQSGLGYAMTDAEFAPVVERAPGLSTALSPGTCVKG